MCINPIRYNSNIENVYKSSASKKEEAISPEKDVLEISSLGRSLSNMNLYNENIDVERIKNIKQKIENGTYSVDSNKIANKIINSVDGKIF